MLHCFVIDDSEIIRKFSRLIFEGLGFRVSEADGPVAALERLRTESPDYILVDWRMPDCNSIDFISKLRTLPLEKRPHIIYVVTEHDPHDVKRALSHGADSFLLKPFNREIIEMKLAEIRASSNQSAQ
ncbi:response regulator [Hyphomicrobium methylovorum]|uniref:response regulator n=1 Tax=Hyphomicrobium methylovorum TaxID=84 RepID=UPI0015E64067|nr:response regulator [Hyphomicrobium methylovorum]MBA2125352.1 response regulator [Hyphomicrobium methylovorum]